MKNIKNFIPDKYNSKQYTYIEDCVYLYKTKDGQEYYCTAITFEQEPEYEEGSNSARISQYPMEDILDKFNVFVSDFFKDLNNGKDNVCYCEFSGFKKESICNLKNSIVGKHVYNKEIDDYIILVIE